MAEIEAGIPSSNGCANVPVFYSNISPSISPTQAEQDYCDIIVRTFQPVDALIVIHHDYNNVL